MFPIQRCDRIVFGAALSTQCDPHILAEDKVAKVMFQLQPSSKKAWLKNVEQLGAGISAPETIQAFKFGELKLQIIRTRQASPRQTDYIDVPS